MRTLRERADISPNIDFGLCELPDCIDLLENGKCARLNIGACHGIECSFLRTKSETEKSVQHWSQRLSSLDKSKQREIAKKYYGGTMPWEFKKKIEAIK